MSRGYDIEEFFGGLLEHFRNILTAIVTRETKLLEVSRTHAERYSTEVMENAQAPSSQIVWDLREAQ